MFTLVKDTRLGRQNLYHWMPQGCGLMRIDPDIQNCVAFLCYKNDRGKTVPVGTGFFVVVDLPEVKSDNVGYLVTAQHVINGIFHNSKSADRRVYVRLNSKSGGIVDFSTEWTQWQKHEDTDVAAIRVDFQDVAKYKHLPYDMFMDHKGQLDYKIGPGDDVFFAGLFVKHFGATQNIPIIRAGHIAAMPNERVRINLHDGAKPTKPMVMAYLVEARSIGGLSGSPVFTYLNDPFPLSTPRILGLMYGHWTTEATDEPAEAALADDDIRSKLHTGIGIVIPAENIIEVLNCPEFVEDRRLEAERIMDENTATPD